MPLERIAVLHRFRIELIIFSRSNSTSAAEVVVFARYAKNLSSYLADVQIRCFVLLAKDLVTALPNESLNNSTHVMKHEAHGRNAAAETYQSDRRGCEHRVTKRFVRAVD